jgi:acyl-CoA thioester hydrolase
MNKPYFPVKPDQPGPLQIQVKRCVRFQEVDSLGIVWHGHYSSYFEDARVALGDSYGIGYLDFYREGIPAPIKKFHVDYLRPLRFKEEITIEAIWHWSEAARINFEYRILNQDLELATTGYTVQLMLDMEYNVLMVAPPFYVAFQDKWKAGEFV